jgi:hypothetical protein
VLDAIVWKRERESIRRKSRALKGHQPTALSSYLDAWLSCRSDVLPQASS